jgi:glutathione-regulated potassium-efflux system ancillary protein KefG
MKRILILFAHPAFERSRNHRQLIHAVRDIEGVTIHDLYEAYPDLVINVKREQELLVNHDVIVMQHPMYWYSAPAMFKEWQDLVLEHRWAYGVGGTALKGKIIFNAISTGGGRDAYQKDGLHGHGIRDFLLPFERTAELCQMIYLAPFVIHGSLGITDEQQVAPFARDYKVLLEAIRDDRLDLKKAAAVSRLNDDMPLLLMDTEK